MKTNVAFLVCLLLPMLSTSGLCSQPKSEMPFSFPDQHSQSLSNDGLYLSPVHPGLALDVPSPLKTYPRVNVSLAGDLCGIDGASDRCREIRRRSSYLSVELAEVVDKPGPLSQARISPVVALPMLLLVLLSGCFRAFKPGRD